MTVVNEHQARALAEASQAVEEVQAGPRRFPRYAAYKASGIGLLGDLPEHWNVRKLKFIADVRNSNVDKKSVEGQEPVQLCNYVDVYYNDYITSTIDFMAATATTDQVKRFKLQPGDVIITKDSEAWDDIAVPALVDEQFEDVLCGYHLALIRPDRERVDGEYLFRSFTSHAIRDQFRIRANGVTRFGLPRDGITSALFPVPPHDEQKAIAAFLRRETARIDALVEKKWRLIELLKEKHTALISHAITKGINPDAPMKPSGIDWLSDVPKHWEFRKLGFMVKMRGGSTPSKSNDAYWKGNIPWVSPKDMKVRQIADSEDHVSELALEETSLQLINPPVVLMVVRGMILAHTFPVAITRAPVTINQDMKALTPDADCTPEYMLNLLDGISRAILGIVEGSAHGTRVLRMPLWKHVGVYVPDIAEQATICDYIDQENSRFDGLIGKVQQAIDALYEHRSALISAAVTGKIDVRGEVVA